MLKKSLFLFLVTPLFFIHSKIVIGQNKIISVVAVGDIMPGTNFPNVSYLPPEDNCYPLIKPALNYLKTADVAFGNLEGCYMDSGKLVKNCKDTTICYAFRSPERYFNCVANAGFDLVSLANNHAMDFGQPGLSSTIKLLDENNIKYAGPLSKPTTIFEKNGLKYGLCAFSPNDGTCDITDTVEAKRIVEELTQKVDIVIASFHGGAEGKGHQHVTREEEIFYEENRGNVYRFSRILIDAGADLIFGHGPHVCRAFDVYKNRFIAYSLGNFCTYARFNLRGPNAAAPIVRVHINEQGEFLNGIIFPFKQTGEGGVHYDPNGMAIKKIQNLTHEDFPELNIIFEDDGSFYLENYVRGTN